jgi:hypothetical protein
MLIVCAIRLLEVQKSLIHQEMSFVSCYSLQEKISNAMMIKMIVICLERCGKSFHSHIIYYLMIVDVANIVKKSGMTPTW